MNDVVARLAYSRDIETEYKAEVADAERELRATGIWVYLEQQREYLKTAQADVADAEADVRKQALAVYVETANKAPHPAIKIKMYMVLDYKPIKALNYAREHLPTALKLVKRTFEKAAKILELDFVTITQEPRATIARDLSKYLPEEDSSDLHRST